MGGHNPQPQPQTQPSDHGSWIHDQMAVSVAVAVDCALRLRTFAQKFLT